MTMYGLIILALVTASYPWSTSTSFTPPGNQIVYAVDFSSDGNLLAAGGKGSKVGIYDTSNYGLLGTYNAGNEVKVVKFSPNGNYFLVGYESSTVDIVDSSTYSRTGTLSTGHSKVYDIDFYDDSTVVTCGDDQKFKIWDPTAGWSNQHTSSGHGDVVWQCKFNSNGKVAIGLSPGTIRIYDSSYSFQSSYSPGATGQPFGLDFKAGSDQFVMGSDNGKCYRSTSSSHFVDTGSVVHEATWAESGQFYMCAGQDYKIRIYESSTNSLTKTFTLSSAKIWAGDFMDDGCALAVGADDYKVHIFQTTSGSCGAPSPPATPCIITTVNLPGCAICIDSSNCHECAPGYYLHTDYQCYGCSGTLDGCAACSSGSNCLACLPGYYLSSNTCSKCHSAMTGCIFCSSSSVCQECHNDYYLSGGSCSSCTNIANCLKCSSSSDCIQCAAGYYKDISNACQVCPSNCLACLSNSVCATCDLGYYLSGGLCSACPSNCLACDQNGVCLDCAEGSYIDGGGTCTLCSSPCSTCSSVACLSCIEGYLNGGNCYSCPAGCKICSDASTCSKCEATHTLVGSTCTLCESLMEGCYICTGTTTCTTCLSGFYLNGANCAPCADSLEGCQLCSSSSICLDCENGYYLNANQCHNCAAAIPSCYSCPNSGQCSSCLSGFFINSTSNQCSLCSDQIPNCIHCASESVCVVCHQDYLISSGICQYDISKAPPKIYNFCQEPFCLSCDEDTITNTNYCIQCMPTYYLDGNSDCQGCSALVSGCVQCTSSGCTVCESGYYMGVSSCQLCSSSLTGCIQCSSSSSCLECQTAYYLDSNVCRDCSGIVGCQECSDGISCSKCKGGYYLNNSNCQPCTSVDGCLFCNTSTNCFVCATSYYNDNGVCTSCVGIANCFHCISASQCIQCDSGFSIKNGLCEEQNFNFDLITPEPEVEQVQFSLKTYYISQYELKHILFVRGAYFDHPQIDWASASQLLLNGPTGQVQLSLRNADWGDNFYSIVFFTDNPYKINAEDIAKMNFTRRLLQNSDVYRIQLSIEENTMKLMLPNYNQVGSLQLDYSLDKPQFIKTVVNGVNTYQYHIFGIVIICILFAKYLMKALYSVPRSADMGQIIPHILALKSGVLILYPTYIQFFDYCSGFANADFPWANTAIGSVLGNQSDYQPFSYASFYINMNFGSMYLVAFSVCLFLALIVFIVFKKVGDQERMKSCFNFLYCFFIFGLTFAGCASLQGAIMNPLSSINVNGTFYIIGIFIYFGIVLDCYFSLSQHRNLWKARVFIKATVLSLSHLNPVFCVSTLLIVDVVLIIYEYRSIRCKPQLIYLNPKPKLWLANQLLVQLALTLLILLPAILLSLLIVSAIVIYLLLSEIYLHWLQFSQQRKIQENMSSKEQNNEKENELYLQNMYKEQSQTNEKSLNMSNGLLIEEQFMMEEGNEIIFSKKKKRNKKKLEEERQMQEDIVCIDQECE